MLNTHEHAMEWAGFNNRESRNSHFEKKLASTYMFGPLIDGKASHPDTVLTSLECVKKTLVEMGMSNIHISVDLQLYMVACQIKWNNIDCFKNVILRPGIMHTASTNSCVGQVLSLSSAQLLVEYQES